MIRDIRVRVKFGIPDLSQSPDTGKNSDGGISDLQISGQSLIIENCDNSQTSNDIDMKFGPVTRLGNRNTPSLKNWRWYHVGKFLTSVSFFQVNLKQFGSQISDAWSVKLTCSLVVTFHLTNIDNRTKKSLTQLSCYCFD